MKNLFIGIIIIVLMIVVYKIFVKIKTVDNDKILQAQTVKRNPRNSSTCADDNPIRRTRIGKKIDNIYNKHNKYTDEVLN